MAFGRAAHDRQLLQEIADGMGDCFGLQVGRWRMAPEMDVIER
jgi:hypothetical protein